LSSLESKIESEINQRVSENKTPEYNYGFSGSEIETLSASSIVNSIFMYLTKDWEEEDRQRFLLNDQECKLFDKAITPLIYQIAIRLGLAVVETFSIIVITSLLLPRIFSYFSLSKKHEKKNKEVDKIGA
jgi:hypothetical protein